MFLHRQLPESRRDGRFSMSGECASSLPCAARRGCRADAKAIAPMRIVATVMRLSVELEAEGGRVRAGRSSRF